ncbi:MAG: hypothetical protein Q7T55_00465 [Solirubrobacteraceae bacterium]|nr:hypothetical protein [Solirubrobacteraceae bacterium]
MSRLSTLRRRAAALTTLLLAVTAGTLTTAPTASAGEFRVFACQLANGAPIGLGDWTMANNIIGNGANECASQGLAYFQLGPPQTGTTSWSGVGVSIPDGLVATSIRANRWVRMNYGDGADHSATPAYQLRYSPTGTPGNQWFGGDTAFRDQCRFIDNCLTRAWDDPSSPAAFVATDLPGGAKWIGFAVACLQEGAPNGACSVGGAGRAHLRVNRLDLSIQDSTNPVISGPSGSLLQGGTRSGSQNLTFAASDVGGGIYQAILQIDGTEIARIRPDSALSCRDAGALPEMELEFTRLQPCARSLNVAFDVDTARLSNGNHRVTTLVRDAAGNLSNVISQDIVVANTAPAPGPGPGTPPNAGGPNGSGDLATGALGHKGERKTMSTRFGVRPTITGKLLDAAGKPIARAQLDVFERIDLSSGTWAKVGTAETDVAGKYRFKPLAGSSKRVRFAYSTVVGSDTPRATREVRLAVSAAMSISARSKVVPRGGTVRLSGKVRIDGLPKTGVSVEVQVKRPSGWSAVSIRSVDKRGVWTYQRRLRTAANATLQFRARLIPANDVPAGESRSTSVKVRIR